MYRRNILFTDARSHNGVFGFTGVMTQRPTASAGTGISMADFLLGYPANATRSNPALVGRIRHVLARFPPGRLPVDEQSDAQNWIAVRVHAVVDRLPEPGGGLRSDARQAHHRVEGQRSDRSRAPRRWPCRLSPVRRPHPDKRPGRRPLQLTKNDINQWAPRVGSPIVLATGPLFAAGTACSTKPKARAAVSTSISCRSA